MITQIYLSKITMLLNIKNYSNLSSVLTIVILKKIKNMFTPALYLPR